MERKELRPMEGSQELQEVLGLVKEHQGSHAMSRSSSSNNNSTSSKSRPWN